jgi:hypothetical protein
MKPRRKILSLCAIALAVAMLFTACDNGSKPTAAKGSSAPQSQIAGYYDAAQSVSGGIDLNVINLKDIKIVKNQADIEITFEFVEGSINLGMQEKAVKGVPKYSTQWIDGLNRLVLKMSGLYYWDYEVYEDEIADTPIIGIFRQNPVDSPDTRIYINLKDKIAYRIEEKDNVLHLYLRAISEAERSDYYVILNAFDEYTNGKIADEEGLLPTLCADKTNVMLISKPFATQEEAQAFLAEKEKSLLPNLPGKVASVIQLKNKELPVYDAKGAMAAYANTTTTRTNGTENTSPVLITNGRFLCWRPDNMAYVYATPFYLNDSSGAGTQRYEKIYLIETGSTTPTLLSGFEYTDICKAEFSDDGRYLAFLDQQGDKQALFIYDTKSNAVYTASETGFGDDTANFTWGSDETANTIYAITGDGSMLQLMAYELKDKQLPKVQTLLESAFTGGTMGYYEGKIYYSQYSEEADENGIFSFDVASRSAARVCSGADFMLNRQTGSIAVLSLASDQEAMYDLNLYDIKTKRQTQVVKKVPVLDVVWSGDGTILYYTAYSDDASTDATAGADGTEGTNQDRFPLALHRYSLAGKEDAKICDIVMGALAPSDKNQELLLTCLLTQEDQVLIPITFRVAAGQ